MESVLSQNTSYKQTVKVMLDFGIGTKIQHQYGICTRTSDIYWTESLLHFTTAHDKDAKPSLASLLREMSNDAKIQTEASCVAASPGKCNKCLRIFACKWGKYTKLHEASDMGYS